MENREIARLLSETADLMEIAGEDSFRIRSYQNAATAVEGYPESISAILRNPEKKVTDIPGIGKGIASVLLEIEQRGSFERRDQMLERYPPTALELLHIQAWVRRASGLYGRPIAFRLLMIWNAFVRSTNFAIFRAWARSWKKKFSNLSRDTGNVPADSC